MESATLADIAKVTVDDFRRGREAALDPSFAQELTTAIELALLTAVRAERRACAAECTRRSELWQRTADRRDAPESVLHEARGRSNEEAYLADILATRR